VNHYYINTSGQLIEKHTRRKPYGEETIYRQVTGSAKGGLVSKTPRQMAGKWTS
jgi:hypothetical protein